MWVGGKGGALDITRIVPSECTKGSLIRVWLTRYRYRTGTIEPSYMEVNRIV